mmetsp:Transcript_35978/g.94647  ORF Transcript_35978/g.94647 Transcript_35978/m.94647 type:complete len:228 (+) Transcript_35978:128-811(+)
MEGQPIRLSRRPRSGGFLPCLAILRARQRPSMRPPSGYRPARTRASNTFSLSRLLDAGMCRRLLRPIYSGHDGAPSTSLRALLSLYRHPLLRIELSPTSVMWSSEALCPTPCPRLLSGRRSMHSASAAISAMELASQQLLLQVIRLPLSGNRSASKPCRRGMRSRSRSYGECTPSPHRWSHPTKHGCSLHTCSLALGTVRLPHSMRPPRLPMRHGTPRDAAGWGVSL